MRDIDLVIVDRDSNDEKRVKEILLKNGYSFRNNGGLKIHSFTNFIINHYTKIVNVTYTSRDNYEHWRGFCYNIVTPSYLESFFGGAIDEYSANAHKYQRPPNKQLCDLYLGNLYVWSEADLSYIHEQISKHLRFIVELRKQNELEEKMRTPTPALFWVDEGELIAQIQKETRSE